MAVGAVVAAVIVSRSGSSVAAAPKSEPPLAAVPAKRTAAPQPPAAAPVVEPPKPSAGNALRALLPNAALYGSMRVAALRHIPGKSFKGHVQSLEAIGGLALSEYESFVHSANSPDDYCLAIVATREFPSGQGAWQAAGTHRNLDLRGGLGGIAFDPDKKSVVYTRGLGDARNAIDRMLDGGGGTAPATEHDFQATFANPAPFKYLLVHFVDGIPLLPPPKTLTLHGDVKGKNLAVRASGTFATAEMAADMAERIKELADGGGGALAGFSENDRPYMKALQNAKVVLDGNELTVEASVPLEAIGNSIDLDKRKLHP